jgi:hypothetical protein
MTMPVTGGSVEQRAVEQWRNLFRRQAQRLGPPQAGPARNIASVEDVRDALQHVALAFDQLITLGRMTPEKAQQSMALLLLVRDWATPLPPNAQLDQDLRGVVDALRLARKQTGFRG